MTSSAVKAVELDDPLSVHLLADMVRLRPEETVDEALEALREEAPQNPIVYFYVVDDDHRLVGVVPTRRLLISPSQTTIRELMLTDLVTVAVDATVLDACRLFAAHRLLALPVVDSGGRLLGVVQATMFTDELSELAARQEVDDLFQLIGIHVERGRQVTPWSGFRDRFPWLLTNIAGGFLCALVSSRYEALLQQAVVLALFTPLVLAVSESVSIQSLTLTLRSLHSGTVSVAGLLTALRHELLTAILLGSACGATVGVTSWLWRGDPLAAVTIGTAIVASMSTACLLGVALPTAVRALGRDPSVAAGPVVLASTDIATLLFYFNLAGMVLG